MPICMPRAGEILECWGSRSRFPDLRQSGQLVAELIGLGAGSEYQLSCCQNMAYGPWSLAHLA
jgi:hypothetical protein